MNGREYTIDSTKLPEVANDYLWKRGAREYMDNYHASITRKGWESTDEQFESSVSDACTEALDRLVAGDIPGTRAPADPNAKSARVVAAAAKEAGVDLTKIDPEKLTAWLKRQQAA